MSDLMQAEKAIRSVYGDAENFVTPNFIEYGKINSRLYYELSWGTRMLDVGLVYGVSFVGKVNGGHKKMHYISRALFSKKDMYEYVEKIRGRFSECRILRSP